MADARRCESGARRLARQRNADLLHRLPNRGGAQCPASVFNGSNRHISSYDWKSTWTGDFDPATETYLSAAAFPTQPRNLLGNATPYNALVRSFLNLNENASLAKSFNFAERFRLDFRVQALNLFNRVVFAAPSSTCSNLNGTCFGAITSQYSTPRQMQLALKLYW